MNTAARNAADPILCEYRPLSIRLPGQHVEVRIQLFPGHRDYSLTTLLSVVIYLRAGYQYSPIPFAFLNKQSEKRKCFRVHLIYQI